MRYQPDNEPIPGYKLVSFLGEGSYGEVWKAIAPGGKPIALKLIRMDSKSGLKELRAITLMSKVPKSRGLLSMHGSWLKDPKGNIIGEETTDSIRFELAGNKELIIAMDLGEKSLADRLNECMKASHNQEGVPLRELLRYMEDAAIGIDYLNEKIHDGGEAEPISIVHCDIKPANLLIVGRGVEVCDYGVARALASSPEQSARNTLSAGTPAYAPPELIGSSPCTFTDQYSLAITYFELRTGKLPFPEGQAFIANLQGNLNFAPLSEAEQKVLRTATSLKPENRFEHCEAFVDALKASQNVVLGTSGSVPMPGQRQAFSPHSDSHEMASLRPANGAAPSSSGEVRLTAAPHPSNFSGTMNFSPSSQYATPLSANDTNTARLTPATSGSGTFAKQSTGWRTESTSSSTEGKGSKLIPILLVLLLLIGGGGAGAYFLFFNKDKQQQNEIVETKPDTTNTKTTTTEPTQDELQQQLQSELTAKHFPAAKQTLSKLDERFPGVKAQHKALLQPALDDLATQALASISGGQPKDAEQPIEQIRLFDAARADKLADQVATAMSSGTIDPATKRRQGLFDEARTQFAAGMYEPALTTLKQIETLAPTTAERDTLQALQKAWQDVQAANKTAIPDVAALFAFHKQQLSVDLPETLRDTPDETAIRTRWQTEMASKVEAAIPLFDGETDWQSLARICVNDATPTPTINGLLHECWVELVARRGDASVDGKPLTLTQPKDDNLPSYVKQMVSLQTLSDPSQSQPKQASAATALAQTPKTLTQDAKWLNPFRVNRLALALAGFSQDYKGKEPLEPPYPAKESQVVTWLTTANDLAAQASSITPKPKRLQIAYELLLARWSEGSTDTATRTLADSLKKEPDLARTLGWTTRDSLRFNVAVAETNLADPKSRATAYASYLDALQQPLEAADHRTVLPFVDKRILQPFLKPETTKAIAAYPQPDRNAAANLYSAMGKQLYANRTAWAESGQLKEMPLSVALSSFDQAVTLAGRADDLAWRGLIRSELPQFELTTLLNDAQEAMKADPKNPLSKLLDAVATLESANSETDAQTYLDRLRRADSEFKKTIETFQTNKAQYSEALATAYRRASRNAIKLANTDHSSEKAQAEELATAVDWAKQLISLDANSAEGQNTLGCAVEDQAWLLKNPDRFEKDGSYARADDAFRKAIDPNDPLPQARLNRGRNLFKWAEDMYAHRSLNDALDDTKLTQAKAQIQDAINDRSRGKDDPVLLCECHLWLGKLEMLRLQDTAAISAKTELYESAGDHFRKAIDFAEKANHQQFLSQIVSNLAVAERTMGLTDGITETNAAKIVDQLDGLIEGKIGGGLDPSHKALLEYNRAYIAAKNKISTIPLTELKGKMLDIVREGSKDVSANGVDYAIKLLIGAVKLEAGTKNLASALKFAKQARDLAIKFPTIISQETRAEATAWVGLVEYAQGIAESDKREQLNSDAREQLWTAINRAPNSTLRWKWNLVLAHSYDDDVQAEISNLKENAILSPSGRAKLLAAFSLYRMYGDDYAKTDGLLADLDGISLAYIDQFNRSRQNKFEEYKKQLKAVVDESKNTSQLDRLTWKLAIAEIDWFLYTNSEDTKVFRELIDRTEPLLKDLPKELTNLDDPRLKQLLQDQIERVGKLVQEKKKTVPNEKM